MLTNEAGPATFTVLQQPEGFSPRRFYVERSVSLVGGGKSITVVGPMVDDQTEAELWALGAAKDDVGAAVVSPVGGFACNWREVL